MDIEPYLTFDGNCEEALEFYCKCLGGKVTMLMRYAGSPMDTPELPAQTMPPSPELAPPAAAVYQALEPQASQASQASPSPDAPQATQGRATTQASAGTTEAPSGVANFSRESFRYARSGRRDPFVTLMAYGELRPLITELRVTSIAFDPMGGSVAVLRDLGTKEQYRVRVGESLGRMRVASIAKKAITFTIEEFGYSRQETLALVDPKKESSQ